MGEPGELPSMGLHSRTQLKRLSSNSSTLLCLETPGLSPGQVGLQEGILALLLPPKGSGLSPLGSCGIRGMCSSPSPGSSLPKN